MVLFSAMLVQATADSSETGLFHALSFAEVVASIQTLRGVNLEADTHTDTNKGTTRMGSPCDFPGELDRQSSLSKKYALGFFSFE